MNWEEFKKTAKNFKSDGCTAAPDLFWKDCCKEHDFYYRTPEEMTGVSRAEADKRLRDCMRKKGSGPVISWIYWAAVRVVGWNFWKG